MPFTPVQTLIGAGMMSVSAYHLLILNGGVLGVSGFAHRTISWLGYTVRGPKVTEASKEAIPTENPDPEHLALLSLTGLVVGGATLGFFREPLERQLHAQVLDVYNTASTSWAQTTGLATAGVLVGLGTKLSNGCTSGHMLCGVSRLAPRSLVATAIFFSVGVLTHLSLRNLPPFVLDLAPEQTIGRPSWALVLLQLPILVYRYGAAFISGLTGKNWARRLVAFHTSFHFALGLILSGMLRPSKILGFMNITPTAFRDGSWDPSLALIIVGGILPQLVLWQVSLGKYVSSHDTQPEFASKWSVPLPGPHWRDGITPRLIMGAILFGVGWGMYAICPGPAFVLIGAGITGEKQLQVWSRAGVWVVGFVSGSLLANLW